MLLSFSVMGSGKTNWHLPVFPAFWRWCDCARFVEQVALNRRYHAYKSFSLAGLKSESARFCCREASHTSYASTDIRIPWIHPFVHGGSTTVLQLGDEMVRHWNCDGSLDGGSLIKGVRLRGHTNLLYVTSIIATLSGTRCQYHSGSLTFHFVLVVDDGWLEYWNANQMTNANDV